MSVCVHVCVCACLGVWGECVSVCVCVWGCESVWGSKSKYVLMTEYVCVLLSVSVMCACAWIYGCKGVCVSVCVLVYVCSCVCVSVCVSLYVCTECYITTELHPLNSGPSHPSIYPQGNRNIEWSWFTNPEYIFIHISFNLLSVIWQRNTKNTFVPRYLYIVHIKRILSRESPKT